MRGLPKRLEQLETKSSKKFLALELRSDETRQQAISRQYPDGLPKSELYLFKKYYAVDDKGGLKTCA